MSIAGMTYAQANYVFELDGTNVGYINSVSGGSPEAELYEHNAAGVNWKQKNVGPMKYSPFKFTAGAGMSRGFWEWVEQSMNMNAMYKDCGALFADFNFKAQRRLDMLQCLVTKLDLPAWKGDSKSNAYFNFELSPTMARHTKAGGEDVRGTLGPISKQWHESNFNVTIPGLPTARTYAVEGAGYEVKLATDAVGFGREYTIHPANFNCKDISITFSKADASDWEAYANEWFRLGKNTQSDEKDITVAILGADQSTQLGYIEFLGCGMKKAQFHEENKAHSENVARCKVEWFVTEMKLHIEKADA